MKNLLILLVVVLIFSGIGCIIFRINKAEEAEEANKVLREKIVFNGDEIDVNEEFNFNPENNCVADIKAVLTAVNEDSITLKILEEQRLNRNFYPSDKGVIQIQDKTCILAYPLCMDVAYSYCFDVDISNITPSYTYELESKSTMPKP